MYQQSRRDEIETDNENQKTMSNKARSILKVLAVILVLLAVVMQIGWVIIPSISIYKFWFVVIAFGLLLISSK
jgi:cell division septal protein FtsQ